MLGVRIGQGGPQLPEELAAGRIGPVEGADADEPLDDLLAEPRAGDEVADRGVRPALPLRLQDLPRALVDPLHLAQPEPNGPATGAVGIGAGVVLPGRCVDVDRQDPDAVPLGVVDDDRRRVEAHRLVVQHADGVVRRVVALEPGGVVADLGEGCGMGAGEAELGEGGALLEQLLRVVPCQAGAHGAAHEPPPLGLHLGMAAVRAHRLAEDVGLDRGVAAHVDGDLHDLLLVQDHAQGVLQDRLQGGMRVGDLLLAGAPAQVRVDRVALHRTGPNDRDLDDEILEPLGARLGEALHLGAGLDLEHANRIGGLDGPIHLRVVVRQRVEVDPLPRVSLDPVEGVAHHAQGSQAEEVDLHQAELLDVLLVVLGHDPVGHRGPLDRHEVDERRAGDEHAADVDAEVAREAIDLGAQLEQPLPPVARRVAPFPVAVQRN